MGIFALSTLLVAGAGIYIFSRVFPNFQPGNKKVQADLKEMKAELEPEAAELVPLQTKDLELLAGEEEDRSVKKRFTTLIQGRFSTIFHEPVALYSYKQYLSTGGKDAVLYVKTTRHDYFYWIKPKGTKVVIDNSLIGTLENGETLLGGKRNHAIAQVKRNENEYMPVVIGEREVGSIVKAKANGEASLSSRAFGYVQDNLNPQEEAILLALTFHELVMRNIS